ncbi:hypothetical protein TM7_0065 [candidate division TM7 genomosp. GTL1]|nr:hypothetical protein TM7_0065 [candidate division TM7 genomosp. GTL1]
MSKWRTFGRSCMRNVYLRSPLHFPSLKNPLRSQKARSAAPREEGEVSRGAEARGANPEVTFCRKACEQIVYTNREKSVSNRSQIVWTKDRTHSRLTIPRAKRLIFLIFHSIHPPLSPHLISYISICANAIYPQFPQHLLLLRRFI